MSFTIRSIALAILVFGLSCTSTVSHINDALKDRLDQAFSGVNDTVDHLGEVLDQQRDKLTQDLGTLVQTSTLNLEALVDQEQRAIDALTAAGQNVTEKATADLIATMQSVQTMAQNLTTAIQNNVVDDIKRVSAEIDRQRTLTLQQINATVQGILRPAIAQLTASGDQLVGTVENAVATMIWRIAAVATFLAGAIALFVILRGGGPFRGGKIAFIVFAIVLVVAGMLGEIFASVLGRLSGTKFSIPSGDVLCDRMVKSSAALAAKKPPPAAPASGLRVASMMSPRALKSAVVHTPTPSNSPDLATQALQDANACLTYATTAQMADLAAQDFTLALARVTNTVFCHSQADCAVLGQGCALEVGVCLPFGVYCDTTHTCGTGQSCVNNRCGSGTAINCTVANDCPTSFACNPDTRTCVHDVQPHQACALGPPNFGPCATGELQIHGGLVVCTKTVPATPEVCDGIDNDCNGTVDDGLHTGAHCIANAQGACRDGQQTCANGKELCVAGTPSVEICDGKDNDCNGAVDDNVPPRGACTDSRSVGECRNGQQVCQGGTYQCVGSAPSGEVCDNKDNNCDGRVDEGGVCPQESVFHQPNDERHALFGIREEHRWGGNCGRDAFGRARHRTSCVAKDAVDRHESHCEPVDSGYGPGWVSGDETDCTCNVHYGTVGDAHVRCNIEIFAAGGAR